jgi:hypothetical protein
MSDYRAGQRIRAEWPDGGAVEGVVEWRPANDLVIPVGDIVVGLGALLAKDCTVTVLSEPRPEEPTGLGAVVEADCPAKATIPRVTGRRRWARTSLVGQPWMSSEDGVYCDWIAWSDLIDPVVLAEGWT